MENTTYDIRIDKEIREQADTLYKSMGLFLTQSVIQEKMPIAEIIAATQMRRYRIVESSLFKKLAN